ncbi:MAG: hypothetical protein ACR2II_08460 [Chthoniobacterales bacterium]
MPERKRCGEQLPAARLELPLADADLGEDRDPIRLEPARFVAGKFAHTANGGSALQTFIALPKSSATGFNALNILAPPGAGSTAHRVNWLSCSGEMIGFVLSSA